jgi:hypothetical protein
MLLSCGDSGDRGKVLPSSFPSFRFSRKKKTKLTVLLRQWCYLESIGENQLSLETG